MMNNGQPWIDLDESLVASGPEPAEEQEQRRLLSLGRRTFLEALGISGAVALAGCERLPIDHALPLLEPDEDAEPGVSLRYASTCLACPASCGLLVTVRDGRPIKLEGHPDHPLSKGGLCALGQAGVRGLYDAGRLRQPTIGGKPASWQEVDALVLAGLAAAKGKVAVLTPSVPSPTARAVLRRFAEQHGARHVEYDPGVGATGWAAAEAYRLLDGAARYPSPVVATADVLLTIGGDPLGTGPEAVSLTRAYADRRRDHKRPFRHLHLEGSLSLTGAGADVRLQLASAERALAAATLLKLVAAKATGPAAELARGLTAKLPPLGAHAHKLASIAVELQESAGRALCISGSRDPAEQAAVALLNRLLGAEGNTIALSAPRAQRGDDAACARLVADIEGGRVEALLVLDLNPVEQLPGDLAQAVGKLPLSVALTDRPTATAAACKIVAAAHHALERWGDAAPSEHVLTVAQPTVRPLFDTRDPLDSLLHWQGDSRPYRQLLEATWSAEVRAGRGFWVEALSTGLVPAAVAERSFGGSTAVAPPSGAGSGAGPDGGALAKLFGALTAGGDGLEVELLEELGPRDGRGSFNPWLRELPDPLTRSSWAAVARVAPALAKSSGIADGDMVSITVGQTTLAMQARIVPGQHPRVIGVPVGYGVKDGDGAAQAQNGYRVAKLGPRGLGTGGLGATLAKAGGKKKLPLMQWASRTEGRPIVHQVASPEQQVDGHHGGEHALWGGERHYSPHWHMVIDLDACTGCSACVVACQAENNLPVVGPQNITDHRDMYWLRIDRYYQGDEADPDVLFEPMLCAQCDNAPCETVCPAAATVHSHDGLNMQAYNRCVGTRYCANNCPYKVRRFNWFDFKPKDPIERLVLNPDVVVRDRGIMEKCTFCVQRIQAARIEGKKGQAAPEVQTACQQSCPAKAIHFGDANTGQELKAQMHAPRAFQVLADLGIKPSITYLARVRHRNDGERGGKES